MVLKKVERLNPLTKLLFLIETLNVFKSNLKQFVLKNN